MAFRGLFIGIDRYESPGINWLSCARRDAVALHALFSDSLGSGGELLADEQATRAAIEERFSQFATCDPDDVVVIAFSGHGSPSHQLITYDTDRNDLANSSIPLNTLTEWFSRIPAQRLICILDCCFSGGMGAKVLQVEAAPRNLDSSAHLLDQLSGIGRLILTASTDTEPAWEHQRLNHGLLTYFLLQALQGAEEVRESGKLSVYRLLQYVTQQVINAASQIGELQHPTLRGQMDGELTWPIFHPGPLYHAAFPELARTPVTADIHSLTSYGFPESLLDVWAGTIPALNQLQIDAINEFNLLDGSHLVVSAPTSSGKTMIGELAALNYALNRKRSLFLLPLKALVNDKFQYFNRVYGDFGIRTIRATGEIADDIPTLMRGQYDICLMTYEKFTALVLGSPHILNQVGAIVVDEVQMIADQSRGVNLEFLLTLLRVRRQQGIEPQIILLSAVIGGTNGLEQWLGARLLRREERPIPLNEGIVKADGSFRYIDPSGVERVEPWFQPERFTGKNRDWIIPLVRKLIQEGQQVIVFRDEKGATKFCAEYLADSLNLPPAQRALEMLPIGDPSTTSTSLRKTLQGGVAFHNADLDREERQVIEEQFRASNTTLRVIVATTTLAMGVNTPATSVVIEGLEHPGSNGPQPYSIAEYKNIVGRAGRLGFSEQGFSYLLATTAQAEYQAWNRYVKGIPESITSRFLTEGVDPRSLIIRVLVAAQRTARQGLEADDIIGFLEDSFGAFQQRMTAQNWQWSRDQLKADLDSLEKHKLIGLNAESETYQLTPIGRFAGEAGVEVETIIRFVHVLSSLDLSSPLTDAVIVTVTQMAKELDDVYFYVNKKSTQQEPMTWVNELQTQRVPPSVLNGLRYFVDSQHTATLRAKKAVACLAWITNFPLTQIESMMTRHGGFNISGPLRQVRERTCDLIPTVTKVAELLHPGLDLSERQANLIIRLELGIPSAALGLAKAVGSRLSRGDYLSLIAANVCTIEAVKNTDDQTLLSYLGQNERKLRELRSTVDAYEEVTVVEVVTTPMLPPPED